MLMPLLNSFEILLLQWPGCHNQLRRRMRELYVPALPRSVLGSHLNLFFGNDGGRRLSPPVVLLAAKALLFRRPHYDLPWGVLIG